MPSSDLRTRFPFPALLILLAFLFCPSMRAEDPEEKPPEDKPPFMAWPPDPESAPQPWQIAGIKAALADRSPEVRNEAVKIAAPGAPRSPSASAAEPRAMMS